MPRPRMDFATNKWRGTTRARMNSPGSYGHCSIGSFLGASRRCCHGLWLVGVPSLLTKPVLPVVPVEMVAGTWRGFAATAGSCRLIMGDTVLCSHLHGVQQCGEASRG
ncbi:uncharacterized protein LOC120836269 [Ixodes scapularis]|uniref:uncharacterized protein LOC120836269 n=1 Tax=Ixodes scapularis TaxID=6945 RepID=UPI001A9CD62E|nr:uncharacterized protein LOC120836269 [Ixodes scapularis]